MLESKPFTTESLRSPSHKYETEFLTSVAVPSQTIGGGEVVDTHYAIMLQFKENGGGWLSGW